MCVFFLCLQSQAASEAKPMEAPSAQIAGTPTSGSWSVIFWCGASAISLSAMSSAVHVGDLKEPDALKRPVGDVAEEACLAILSVQTRVLKTLFCF